MELGEVFCGGQLGVFVYCGNQENVRLCTNQGRVSILIGNGQTYIPVQVNTSRRQSLQGQEKEYCQNTERAAVMRLILFIGVTSVFLSWLLGQQQNNHKQ